MLAGSTKLAGQCRAAATILDDKLTGLDASAIRSDEGTLGWQIDAAVAGPDNKLLRPEAQAAIDEIRQMSREQLARRLLAKQGGQLADRLAESIAAGGQPAKGDRFVVRSYRFAASTSQLADDQIDKSVTAEPAGRGRQSLIGSLQSAVDRYQLRTDPAQAINRALAEGEGGSGGTGSFGSLAGIVIFTDGQFNGVGDPRRPGPPTAGADHPGRVRLAQPAAGPGGH